MPTPEDNVNQDLLGIGLLGASELNDTPNTKTSTNNMFETIFDEDATLADYMDEKHDITMLLPPIKKDVFSCEDTCREKNKKADEKCKVVRKRVEEALKKAGCPTRLVALKRPGACGSSKSTAKKSTKSKKRR